MPSDHGAGSAERSRPANDLVGSDELVRLLLNSAGEGIYGTDLEGNCTFANPACVELLGFESDDELLGRNLHDLIHHTYPNGEPYPLEECRIYRAFREGEGTHTDDELLWRKDSSSFPAEYWSYPVERDGELLGCVVTFADISDRLRVEEELRQTEKMAALGKLSAGLAHELNNPAAAAARASGALAEALEGLRTATLELARRGLAEPQWVVLDESYRAFRERADGSRELSPLEASDQEETLVEWLDAHGIADGWAMAPTLVEVGILRTDLDVIAGRLPSEALAPAIACLCKGLELAVLSGTITRSTRTISDLVEAVKSYSHMDQAQTQHIDVHVGIEDTLTILGHKLKTSGVRIVRDFDRDLPPVEIRGSELNQVWTNLIDNALDAVGDEGTITISTSRDGDAMTVAVTDDGPGIPEAVQSRVFDPFFTTKDVGQGTGLGLDVARRLVTARCGGRIELCSRPGETTFLVRIPLPEVGE